MDKIKGLEPTNIQSEIIYVDEESNSTSKQSFRSKRSHEKRNRKVKVEHNNNRETLIISQKVKVKKQKIQCIINLTNVREYEEAWRFKHHSKKDKHAPKKSIKKFKEPKSKSNVSLSSHVDPKKSPQAVPKGSLNSPAFLKSKNSPKVNLSAKVERIVPNCLRSKCKAEISSKCCSQRSAKKKCKNKKYPKRRSANKTHEADTSKGSEGYLSSISSPSLQLSPELEDISSDSFTVCSEDHVDTLIKRTRDRERRLSKTFEYKPRPRASTSKHSETSDVEAIDLRSEGDSSIATFILEPQLHPDLNLYTTQPTQPDLKQEKTFDNLNHFNNQHYENNYSAMNTQTYEGNLQMKCNGFLHKYKFYDKVSTAVEKNSHSMDFAFPIKSNGNESTGNKYAYVKQERSETSPVREEFYTYNSPFGIKQEKKTSSPCKHYSQTVTDFWINNKEFTLQERDGKYFTYDNLNKVLNIVPNVKVENNIDFTSFREKNINLCIKTEVNI